MKKGASFNLSCYAIPLLIVFLFSTPAVQSGTGNLPGHSSQQSPASSSAPLRVNEPTAVADKWDLAVGDTVEVLADSLNCRAQPSSSATVLASESQEEEGTILNGSVSSGGYVWWEIAYVNSSTGWSAEGTGSTQWLQNISGGVAYNRTAALAYAAKYWNVVTSDGYFWDSSDGYEALAQGTNVENLSGDDCAHFVSQAIGNQPNASGGGLNIRSRVPPTYGEPGAGNLGDLIIDNGWGVQVNSVSQLQAGDIINYEWTAGAGWGHVALYLGNGTVAAHTDSNYGANWTLGGAYAYRFIHIYSTTGSTHPSVTLGVSPVKGIAPLTVKATAAASGGSGNYSSYTYNWGDGSPSTTTASSSSSHTYSSAGTYLANVSVTDSQGNTGTSKQVTVNVMAPIIVDLTDSTATGTSPLNVSFTASSTGGSGSYGTYAWIFGDSKTSTTTTGTVSHIYTAAGTYNATVLVTDSDGDTATSNPATIVVTSGTGPTEPTVSISVNHLSGNAPLSVTVTATASGGSGSYTSYVYHWGDGSPSTTSVSSTSSHQYTTLGEFEIDVSVEDSLGAVGWSANSTVTVSDNLTVSLSASATTIVEPKAATFSANVGGGSGTDTSFSWSFGDGTYASTSSPSTSHAYESPGAFEATVAVTDSFGKTVTSIPLLITVNPPLVAQISASPSSGAYPLASTVTVTISGGIVPYTAAWGFGDGKDSTSNTSSDTTISIEHTFENAGTFVINVSVEDADGDHSTVSTTVTVSQGSGTQTTSPSNSLSAILTPAYLLSIAAIAGALVCLAVLVRRKHLRQQRPPSDEYQWRS